MAAAILAPFMLYPGAWGANKVTVSISLTQSPSSTSGVSSTSRASGTLSIPTNFSFYFQGLQAIATAVRTAVQTGSVSPLGFCLLHNTDDFNYISIFSDASGSTELMRLYPGDSALFPLAPAATLYAESNTATCDLEIYATAR